MDKDTNEAIQSTALAVVESQQKVIGGALVGGGAAILSEKTDSQTGILEQLRDLTIKSVRGIKDVATRLGDMLSFEKNEARKLREQSTELAKEEKDLPTDSAGIEVPGGEGEEKGEGAGGKLAALSAFMMGLPGVAKLRKLFAPIMAFFGKSGALFKIFGRFGPLAGLTLAVGFIIRYMDDIVKALAPVLDGLKDLGVAMKPLFDAIMVVVDVLAKTAIVGIGQSLTILIAGIEASFKMFMASLEFVNEVLMSIITLDFDRLKDAFSNLWGSFSEIGEKFIATVIGAVMNTIQSIGEIFGVEDLLGSIGEVWANVKAKFFAGVDAVFGFFGAIGDTLDNIDVAVREYLTGIRTNIENAVKNFFRPIGEFFTMVGNKIKEAINGIIQALPLPQFVKDKMKFETSEPAPSVLDTANTGDANIAEKIAKDEANGMETIAGKYKFKDGVLQQNDKNFETIGPGFAEAVAEEIGDAVKVAYDQNNKKYVVVKQDIPLGESTFKTIGESPDGGVDFSGTEIGKSDPKFGMKNVGPLPKDTAPVINNNVIDNGTKTQTTVASTSTHAGSLDVGIDSYHDRHAYANAMA